MDCKTLPEFNQSLRGMCHQHSRYTPNWKINSKKSWLTNGYDPRSFLHCLNGSEESLTEIFRPGACFSKVQKLFGPISGATIAFISSQCQGSTSSNFAMFLVSLHKKHIKRLTFQTNGLQFGNWLVGLEKFSELSRNTPLNVDSNPDLCNAGAVLHQLSYQTNWEVIVMQVDGKPVSR